MAASPFESGKPPMVAVIGGGISGLAAAFRLSEIAQGVRVCVFEAGPKPGGVLRTVHAEGFLFEESADSFITTFPWGVNLCQRLGIKDELQATEPGGRRAFVVHNGRLAPIPDGLLVLAPTRIGPMLRTPILSSRGKIRMALELFVRRGSGSDESLASFATRRFGREAFERLIQPLVSGMYTGDPDRLSIRACLPRFLDMERTHGSLIRAVRQTSSPGGSGARYGLFVGLRTGMGSLIDALLQRLPAETVRCHAPVEQLAREPDGGWRLTLGGEPRDSVHADAVIIATPVARAAQLLRSIDDDLAAELGRITSTGSIVVSLAYRREQVGHPMDGFGFVVPFREQRPILSGSFTSVKFSGRCPEDCVLIRVFLGGAKHPELLDLTDETLIAIAEEQLGQLLDIRGRSFLQRLTRWHAVMPQYEVGHVERIAGIEARMERLSTLALAGNAYHGVGVPQCIRTGELAAERMAEQLGTAGRTGAFVSHPCRQN
jgi:oxygen-dependent protoporphyrinogen oxidase